MARRPPAPFDVLDRIKLRETLPVPAARRLPAILLARPSDFEIITAQAWQIADLRHRLAEVSTDG